MKSLYYVWHSCSAHIKRLEVFFIPKTSGFLSLQLLTLLFLFRFILERERDWRNDALSGFLCTLRISGCDGENALALVLMIVLPSQVKVIAR